MSFEVNRYFCCCFCSISKTENKYNNKLTKKKTFVIRFRLFYLLNLIFSFCRPVKFTVIYYSNVNDL